MIAAAPQSHINLQETGFILDFDCQNISTKEGIMSWALGMGCFATLFFAVKFFDTPEVNNPALTRGESDDVVVPSPQHD